MDLLVRHLHQLTEWMAQNSEYIGCYLSDARHSLKNPLDKLIAIQTIKYLLIEISSSNGSSNVQIV